MNTNTRICPTCDRTLPVTAFNDRANNCRVCTAISVARARKFPRSHAEVMNRAFTHLRVRQLLAARKVA